MGAARIRLDTLLVERGLFRSRSKAAAAVMAGAVSVAGDPAAKAGLLVEPDSDVHVATGEDYVSRGGVKLRNALDRFEIPVGGRRCLDAGASTGGFTDCLLRAGAAHVISVDVSYGQLAWELRDDTRVTVIERRNVRNLSADELPHRPDLIVADLSFIGLAKVLPALTECAAGKLDLLALVKPQFEVGRERVGRGGVVRDPADRHAALVSVGEAAGKSGLRVCGYCESGLPGPAGNRESFIWCGRLAPGETPLPSSELARLALAAEPHAVPTIQTGAST
jgi:23S rRNA (cytidine1920-2'-O)/16S rRNA (cytidine1409-2'-O)-methyltransferase